MSADRPLAIYYEHPEWFRPLFNELDRRGIRYVRLHADEYFFDPAVKPLYAAVFNRMSPSAWRRGRGSAIFYAHHLLGFLEQYGVPVINGSLAFAVETSKATQVALLEHLGIRAPKTRVINGAALIAAAAEGLTFPLLVKPNVGGSGAGIQRFDDPTALLSAVSEQRIETGLDGTVLVQEYHPPVGRSIVRVETLDRKYLYAIRVHLGPEEGFDLCPADLCRTVEGAALDLATCPTDAAKAGLRVERYDPPPQVISLIERVATAAQLDVGGIEYLESERDGQLYVYDINALSNFVADPLKVIGFDPFAKLVDLLQQWVLRRAA